MLKVCLIRFSSLGDIILNSSLPKALKKHSAKDWHLTFLTSKPFDQILEHHPYIDKVVAIDRKKSLRELAKQFKDLHREEAFDLIIDLHGTLRSLYLRLRFPRIPRLSCDKRTWERWLLCGLKLDLLSHQNLDRKTKSKSAGEVLLKRTLRDMSYPLALEEQITAALEEEPLSDLGKCQSEEKEKFQLESPYIALVPSASFPEKRWPLDYFLQLMELLKTLPYKIVVLAGPEDHFCEAFNGLGEQVINLQGKSSLKETQAIVAGAKLCVGNDTGVTHMAEAVGTPTLFILGPTGEEFGFIPHLEKSRFICERLWCRPCTTNGKGNCIRSKRYCLLNISPARVAKELEEMLNA